MNNIRPGIYLHYKGGLYNVLTVAKHTENNDEMVIYHSLNDPTSLWARPLSMFTDMLLHQDQLTSRFRFIRRNDNALAASQIKTTNQL